MLYAAVFLLFAGYLAAVAVTVGGPAWPLVWPAGAFAVVAAGYLGAGPAVFGKRPDGTLRPVHVVVLLPYLLLAWGVWHLHRRLSGGPAWHRIAPGLLLGRRPLPHELPADVAVVVDLAAEFPEPAGVRAGREYHALPTLDGFPSHPERFRELVRRIAAETRSVYVHCANGHGRSAAFAAAVLLARGLAADADDAVRQVRAARPGARPKRRQVRLLAAAPGGREGDAVIRQGG
jgi:predicted protein tyrosine phosphatase